MKKLYLAVDGASKGNPGPAGIGVVIADETGEEILAIGENIGITTNNVAEYTALIRGLQECLDLGAESVLISTDSELLARQLEGVYKVKAPHLQPLYLEVRSLLGRFKEARVTHVGRELNKRADKLASAAANSKNGVASQSVNSVVNPGSR